MISIKLRSQLVILNLLTWVLILIIHLFPTNLIRTILAVPFLLFIPGYTILAALFPQRVSMGGVARFTLSLGLSIAIVPLIGLILNYLPWGITLEPIMYSIAFFILICSTVSWLRQSKLTENESISIELRFSLPFWGNNIRDRVFTVILIAIIISGLGVIGYFVSVPKLGETFTEFYIRDQADGIEYYPRNLVVGEQGSVIIGINNQEMTETSYHVEVLVSGSKVNEIGPIIIPDKQKWEGEVRFIVSEPGENQRVEFLLFKDNETEPYLGPLYVFVNVASI